MIPGLGKVESNLTTTAVMETTSRFVRGSPTEKKAFRQLKSKQTMFPHLNRKKLNEKSVQHLKEIQKSQQIKRKKSKSPTNKSPRFKRQRSHSVKSSQSKSDKSVDKSSRSSRKSVGPNTNIIHKSQQLPDNQKYSRVPPAANKSSEKNPLAGLINTSRSGKNVKETSNNILNPNKTNTRRRLDNIDAHDLMDEIMNKKTPRSSRSNKSPEETVEKNMKQTANVKYFANKNKGKDQPSDNISTKNTNKETSRQIGQRSQPKNDESTSINPPTQNKPLQRRPLVRQPEAKQPTREIQKPKTGPNESKTYIEPQPRPKQKTIQQLQKQKLDELETIEKKEIERQNQLLSKYSRKPQFNDKTSQQRNTVRHEPIGSPRSQTSKASESRFNRKPIPDNQKSTPVLNKFGSKTSLESRQVSSKQKSINEQPQAINRRPNNRVDTENSTKINTQREKSPSEKSISQYTRKQEKKNVPQPINNRRSPQVNTKPQAPLVKETEKPINRNQRRQINTSTRQTVPVRSPQQKKAKSPPQLQTQQIQRKRGKVEVQKTNRFRSNTQRSEGWKTTRTDSEMDLGELQRKQREKQQELLNKYARKPREPRANHETPTPQSRTIRSPASEVGVPAKKEEKNSNRIVKSPQLKESVKPSSRNEPIKRPTTNVSQQVTKSPPKTVNEPLRRSTNINANQQITKSPTSNVNQRNHQPINKKNTNESVAHPKNLNISSQAKSPQVINEPVRRPNNNTSQQVTKSPPKTINEPVRRPNNNTSQQVTKSPPKTINEPVRRPNNNTSQQVTKSPPKTINEPVRRPNNNTSQQVTKSPPKKINEQSHITSARQVSPKIQPQRPPQNKPDSKPISKYSRQQEVSKKPQNRHISPKHTQQSKNPIQQGKQQIIQKKEALLTMTKFPKFLCLALAKIVKKKEADVLMIMRTSELRKQVTIGEKILIKSLVSKLTEAIKMNVAKSFDKLKIYGINTKFTNKLANQTQQLSDQLTKIGDIQQAATTTGTKVEKKLTDEQRNKIKLGMKALEKLVSHKQKQYFDRMHKRNTNNKKKAILVTSILSCLKRSSQMRCLGSAFVALKSAEKQQIKQSTHQKYPPQKQRIRESSPPQKAVDKSELTRLQRQLRSKRSTYESKISDLTYRVQQLKQLNNEKKYQVESKEGQKAQLEEIIGNNKLLPSQFNPDENVVREPESQKFRQLSALYYKALYETKQKETIELSNLMTSISKDLPCQKWVAIMENARLNKIIKLYEEQDEGAHAELKKRQEEGKVVEECVRSYIKENYLWSYVRETVKSGK